MEMIKINLSPVRADAKTELSVKGSAVTLNGEAFDLSLLEDGASAQHEKLGAVTRAGNDYELTVTLTHGKDAPHEARFPSALEITGDYIHEYDFEVTE
tara:strand:+ start:31 stop:324 length:294 start_codon:yes stop_codon:yes gene_type:complete